MADLYVRRGAEDYAEALAALFPTGPAWDREPDTALMRLIGGLAGVWALVDARAANLREIETDPRRTVELLEVWEFCLGLPDACVDEPLTIADRQRAVVARLTMIGGQTPAFFVGLAASIGYTIEILEHAPFMCGISEVGDTRWPELPSSGYRWEIGPPEDRAVWTILVKNARLTWFRAGVGQVGVDHHLEIGQATDLECLIRRFRPAHSLTWLDYSGVLNGGEFAGTP